MKKTFKRMTAVLAAAMIAAAMMVPVSAAEASLLQTTDGNAVADEALKNTDLSGYNAFFTALGATAEQAESIYLAGTVNLKVGESVDLLLHQPARTEKADAELELLVGKQVAVAVTGPADGATVKTENGEYLPMTIHGVAEGTDIYVSNIAPYGLCAYQFVVGSGEGVTNTDPDLYAVAVTEAVAVEEGKVINYNPAPLGVSLSVSGSKWLSQGGVKAEGKQVEGVTIAGHAVYSSSVRVAAPKAVRVGVLNPEDIIVVENNSTPAAKTEAPVSRLGVLNAEDVIVIDNASTPAAKTEAPVSRLGVLNAEDVIVIDNASTPVAKTEAQVSRLGVLNAEDVIVIDNASTPVEKTEASVVRLGVLNPEDIIQIL